MENFPGEFSNKFYTNPFFFRVFKSLRPHPNQSVPLISVQLPDPALSTRSKTLPT